MKVFLHYEDNEDSSLHKTLKITLPKSWKTGPASNLLSQFIECYNPKFPDTPLDVDQMHVSIRQSVDGGPTKLVALTSDAVVVDEIPDRANVYICHGPSESKADRQKAIDQEDAERKQYLASTVACTRLGCNQRFPPGGPYPDCQYHVKPPVFHETAKFWSCCPNKKAYDWDDFQKIPGCATGKCTDVKDADAGTVLGGTDLREAAAPALKSIDDFNKEKSGESSGAAPGPVMDRLREALVEIGVPAEVFNQVVEGIASKNSGAGDDAVAKILGENLKSAFENIAVQQQRLS